MCGIAGLLLNDRSGAVEPAVLAAMLDAIAHRGPDDSGMHIDGPIGMGNRRLAIIDIAGGHQPMANEDGTVRVVYNGECYNFQDLRRELTAHGHVFRSAGDTEVLVHGYEQWGIRSLAERLNGVFAFCIWDDVQRVAHLVRDRSGVKPLYYVERNCGLAFSSELRSLVRSGLCLPKLDERALWSYLLYQFAPTERTLLADVMRLAPGHILTWRDGGAVERTRYWSFSDAPPEASRSFTEATEQLRDLLEDTVRRQMVADVPIGCFLSGGLDSTVVAALMSKFSDDVRTFSVTFPTAPEHDESAASALVAKALSTRHTVLAFDEQEFLRHADQYCAGMDDPIGDAAMFPTYVLSKVAAQHVKVVLSGEGADEVFAGYPYYAPFAGEPLPREELDIRAQAENSRRIREHLGHAMPLPKPSGKSRHSGFPHMVSLEFAWSMLDLDRRPPFEAFVRDVAASEERWLPHSRSHTRLQRALYFDSNIWLTNNLMTKLDLATMAHSLEARVPMLDHRLIEFAFGLPDDFKFQAGTGKRILREAVRPLVPREILDRSKQGFGVPLDDWFRHALAAFARDHVLGSSLVEDGILSRSALETVLFAQQSLGMSLARMIWSLIVLDGWWRGVRTDIASSQRMTHQASARVMPTVDIVIPVHESFSLVRDCIRSIAKHTHRQYRVFVIDDGSSEATHQRLAQLLSSDERFVLSRNKGNLGFVQTCNRGIAMSNADYVVLLNSDTIVTPGWLDGLVACAESDSRIAFVNPLTNESGNTSVRLAPGLSVFTMARRIADIAQRDYPDLTTGVGMCMLLRRSALELVGAFDPVYGQSYCEESDLCMRLTEAGFRVVAADDVYIYHKGLGSHDEQQRNERYTGNRKIFDARWEPAFLRDWGAYMRNDPLQHIRHRVLQGTLSPAEAPGVTDALVDEGRRALGLRHAISAAQRAKGDSPLWGTVGSAMAPDREAALLERNIHRLANPPLRFEERALAYPTPGYVTSLPAAEANKLRITFLVPELGRAGGIISIVQLAREMLLDGHDVKFATTAAEINPEFLNLWLQPLIYRDIDHMVDAFPDSDIVIATFWTTAHRQLRALRQRHSFVSVYFIQDYEAWFYKDTDYAEQRDVVASYACADHHIVKSRWLATMVGSHGPKCTIVPLGLDLGVFYPHDVRRDGRMRVVAVAEPGPQKQRRGFRETIEIFERVRAGRPDVELVLIGVHGSLMPDLPFDYVNTGPLDQNQIAKILSQADILVDASHWQGFGRPGLEAMACGVVPVMTDLGGLGEYARDGENCLLVRPRDQVGAAAAVLNLLNNPSQLARLRANGLPTAARFSHELEAKRHIALYQDWMHEKRQRGDGGASPNQAPPFPIAQPYPHQMHAHGIVRTPA
jgi:asparagine synthase (glutamine-hydrolysing)